jgi:opacity protein-like surface antigen
LKKLVALFVIVAAFLSINNTTFSQPQLKIHVTGGYNLPLPDLKGDLPPTSVDDSNSYAMKNGFNVGADAKYYLGKKRNVGITLSLAYHMFMNSYDVPSSSPATTYKPKINMFTVGLGVEYGFLPKGKANPFIGAEFTGNFISGKLTYDPQPTGVPEYTIKSSSRFGLGIGAGVDIALNKNIGIIVGAKYNLSNLIGKEYDSTVTVGSLELPLNDKENGSVKSKNISFIQTYLGISFFLNQPKKVAKK